jgi:hypothetical protein
MGPSSTTSRQPVSLVLISARSSTAGLAWLGMLTTSTATAVERQLGASLL